LVLPSGQIVTFEYPVKEAIETDGTTIAVLEQPPDRDVPRNAFAVDRQGQHLWQVPRIDLPGPDYFVGLASREVGIWLIHFSGFVVRVEPTTGSVISAS
jgi:hypothetical protein